MALDVYDLAHREEKTLARLAMWLQQSQGCEVSLVISTKDGPEKPDPACLKAFSKLLAANSSRWRHVEFWLPADWFELLALSEARFTSLVSLKMAAVTCQGTPVCMGWEWVQDAPLREVVMRGITFDPWSLLNSDSRITELVLLPWHLSQDESLFTLDNVLRILSQGTRLRRLVCLADDRISKWDEEVVSRVEELDLVLLDGSGELGLQVPWSRRQRLEHFFSILQTPEVAKLSIGYAPVVFSNLDSWPHTSFLAYLARSASSLEVLTLRLLPLFETQIIQYLQKTPALTHLVVEGLPSGGTQRVVGDLLLAALTFMDWRYPLVPRLQSIDFRHCGKRCSEAALLLMIEARSFRNPVAKLKSLKYCASSTPHTLLSKLNEWSKLGMRIDFEVAIQPGYF
ncbi:hypothetical protein ONZ45_g7017 [Pleurotus djamor]|nr:hypothetical protein ONZ45_g7017 [Pleurotus djamor]